MRRTLLWVIATILLTLFTAPAASSQTGSWAELGPQELVSVHGGICLVKCPPPEDPSQPRIIRHEWLETRRVDGAAEQLSYALHAEYSNVHGSSPIKYNLTASNDCRYAFTSGGTGISTAFNVNIGMTYRCDTNSVLTGTINPGFRVKIYRGEMRQIATITVAEYAIWSNGASEATGKTDMGSREQRWRRYTSVLTRG